jgi:ABC-type spermidine/putrescine transport system permease subunit I
MSRVATWAQLAAGSAVILASLGWAALVIFGRLRYAPGPDTGVAAGLGAALGRALAWVTLPAALTLLLVGVWLVRSGWRRAGAPRPDEEPE